MTITMLLRLFFHVPCLKAAFRIGQTTEVEYNTKAHSDHQIIYSTLTAQPYPDHPWDLLSCRFDPPWQLKSPPNATTKHHSTGATSILASNSAIPNTSTVFHYSVASTENANKNQQATKVRHEESRMKENTGLLSV